MLLPFLCLVCVGNSIRVQKDSSLPPHPLSRFASRAVQGIVTKSGTLGARALPTTATLSRGIHAPPKSSWLPKWYQDNESSARSLGHKRSPNEQWWPKEFEEGQTVRHLVTNEECVIKGFFDPSGRKIMKCVSTQDERVMWLQPAQVSHELGQTHTPPNSIKDDNGVVFKVGDDVIVVADKRRHSGRPGRVHMLRGSPTRMQIMFEIDGAHEFDFYHPIQLKHKPRDV